MKIAVIGSGVSGLGAALALSEVADVHLFEKDARFGGHANTAIIDYEGVETAVDTGFIVFNAKNYPNLTALFEHLGVATEDSDMSFSLSVDEGRLEYSCDSVGTIFAQRWRLFDPRSVQALRAGLRFNRESTEALAAGALDGLSLGAFLDQGRYPRFFRDNFLYPMGGAIWSTPAGKIADFPARAFVQFFRNHELLNGFRRAITWRTVSGGSRSYIRKLLAALGPRAQAGVAARSVRRLPGGQARVAFADGSEGLFDHVVLATHPDQTLDLVEDLAADERAALGRIRYADNTAVLHRDPTLMPRRRKLWSSWNFCAERGGAEKPASVTYWMNRLQNLPNARPLFVSLNPRVAPDPALVFGRYSYAHPQFDAGAFAAQTQVDAFQGRGGLWHAGAWLGWGFHEDGLKSGLRVAEALGARPAWARETGAPILPAAAIAAE